jgi:glycine cleavage system H protein
MTPDDRKYSKDHEWALIDGDTATVGITEFATQSLGDVVFVDLPVSGSTLTQFKKFGEVESVKAVSDLFSPVSGEVTERNDAAIDSPQLLNESPYESGWLVRVSLADAEAADGLMSAAEYDAMTAAEG